MNLITILYCTSNKLNRETMEAVWHQLNQSISSSAMIYGRYPIIIVSQKKTGFTSTKELVVGEIGSSCYNFFYQMLLGARMIKTPYIAHVDDDTLYPVEHFQALPSNLDTFLYNTNSWTGGSREYWRKKDRYGMYCTISPTKKLIEILEARFKKYPTPPRDDHHFGEPGKFEHEFGIANPAVETFETKVPIVRFEYRGSINGKMKRFGRTESEYTTDLPQWGNARKLRKDFKLT